MKGVVSTALGWALVFMAIWIALDFAGYAREQGYEEGYRDGYGAALKETKHDE